MTPAMKWTNIEIDHVKPTFLFDISNNDEIKEAFFWKNTQPLLKEIHQQKETEYNSLDYQIQFIKAYQVIKLNEDGLKESVY